MNIIIDDENANDDNIDKDYELARLSCFPLLFLLQLQI